MQPHDLFMSDNERQQFIQGLLRKGECGKHHFARVIIIGKNGVGKTSLMRRLLWQKKEEMTPPDSTDGIDIEKCNINVKNGNWSPCDSKSNNFYRFIHINHSQVAS